MGAREGERESLEGVERRGGLRAFEFSLGQRGFMVEKAAESFDAPYGTASTPCGCVLDLRLRRGITSASAASGGWPSHPHPPLTVEKVDNDRVLSIAILLPDHSGSDHFRKLLQRQFPSRGGLNWGRRSEDEVQIFVQAVQETEEAFVRVSLTLIGVLRRPASQRFL